MPRSETPQTRNKGKKTRITKCPSAPLLLVGAASVTGHGVLRRPVVCVVLLCAFVWVGGQR